MMSEYVKRAYVFQLGDVHYPEHKKRREMDCKDSAFPLGLEELLSTPQLSSVLRKIVELQKVYKPYTILMCGDLTSRGLLDDYENCVRYLTHALNLADADESCVHVVPGNHDIDRSKCLNSSDTSHPAKFKTLQDTWNKEVGELLTVDLVRESDPFTVSQNTKIYSMNSCVGCGEWRSLPEKVQDEIGEVLTRFQTKNNSKDTFELIGEQLDTPMFSMEDVESLNQKIDSSEPDVLPIILAHHNILPQSLTRIDLYTEMINSGVFRTRLAEQCRPIVYCHGHIHTDPVEVLSDPTKSGSQIITISAPELVAGFNLIEIFYNRDRIAIGLQLHKYRTQISGSVIEDSIIRIPLSTYNGRKTPLDQDFINIMTKATDGGIGFHKFLEGFNKDREKKANQKKMSSLLLEAEWRGIVEIIGRTHPPVYWKIRRADL